ncbi:MAG TPA: glycosyltransferase family 1 protein [Actinomycetota bacterium]|nr:glycosyltransferase family 1 protein [Actinomycetota bacterium]
MRIAIDARPAVSAGMTGVGHYARELILRLPGVDPRSTYVAWYLNARRLARPWRWGRRFFPPRPNLLERWTPFPARWFERLSLRWELPRLEWFLPFDVLFAPNFVPPPTARRRVVLTVHDLAFRRFPETAPLATRRWLQRLERALRQAAEIVVVSEATRRDLLELYPVDPGRVTVIHHGIDTDRYRPASQAEVARVRARLGLDRPYLLFLGGIEPRKNIPRLIRAFASGRVEGGGPDLVIAGASVPWNPEGRQQLEGALREIPVQARDRVRMAGYIDGRDKVALLSGAEALVFPSLYEGFGFPILEAMACETPVVTSNVSSLPEVAGDAALLVDPLDETSIAGGIRSVVEDPALRERLRIAGRNRVGLYTWDETARRTASVLHRAAGDTPARSDDGC